MQDKQKFHQSLDSRQREKKKIRREYEDIVVSTNSLKDVWESISI